MAKISRIAEVEEFCAARIAKQVAEEIELKEYVDRTHAQFYLGASFRSALVRLVIGVVVLILFINYYPSDKNPLWPLLGLIAVVEIIRIDCRMDALNRLVRILMERQSPAGENQMPNKSLRTKVKGN